MPRVARPFATSATSSTSTLPEIRFVFYFLCWLWLVQSAHAAHPEALLDAISVMTVGSLMAIGALEAMLLPAKELTYEERKKAEMRDL